MPGGISSTWWVTSTSGGAGRIPRQIGQRRDELLSAAEIESGRRLVEQHQGRGRSSTSGPAAPAGARPTTACRAGARREPPTPMRSRHAMARLVVGRRVRGATTARARRTRASSRRPARGRCGAQLSAEGRRGIPDPPSQTCGHRCARAARRARRPCPCSGARTSTATRSSVVLPQPLAPSTSQRSPRSARSRRRGCPRPSRTTNTTRAKLTPTLRSTGSVASSSAS